MDTENKHTDPIGLLPKVFAGEASGAENRLIEEWLAASPDNRAGYEAFLKLWNLTSAASEHGEINIDEEWRKIESVITPGRRRLISPARFLQIAASVILVSALAFLGLKLTGVRSEKAPSDQLSSLVLPDGSAIFLNAGSRISYKKGFGITHRNLTLKGEAFFEVKRAEGLPFRISAGEVMVRVTGTKFNVRAFHGGNAMVTVTEGKVVLYDAGESTEISLVTGETGNYNHKSRLINKELTKDRNELAWKTRIIDFRNTPLSDVAEILKNTYHHRVNLDPSLKNCTVTVQFDNQSLEAVLSVLRSTLDLDIEIRGKRINISGKGC